MAKHTQVSWALDKALDSQWTSYVISGPPPTCLPHIAYIPKHAAAATLEEQLANGRLMASAPELLAELEGYVANTPDLHPQKPGALAAIAKATGEGVHDVARRLRVHLPIAKAEGRNL